MLNLFIIEIVIQLYLKAFFFIYNQDNRTQSNVVITFWNIKPNIQSSRKKRSVTSKDWSKASKELLYSVVGGVDESIQTWLIEKYLDIFKNL